MRKLAYVVPAALFAALVVAFAMGLGHDPRLVPSALIDRPVPDFALPGLAGGAGLAHKDLAGKISFVNFFASWCLPCREEQPVLMALSQRPGVRLYGIAYKDKTADAKSFLATFGDPYARIGVDRAGRTAINFGVYGVPETYLVDARGRIRYRQVGPLSPQDITTKILPLLTQLSASSGVSTVADRAPR